MIPTPTRLLSLAESLPIFAALRAGVPWEQHHLNIAGRVIPIPRLIRYYGPVPYRYTGGVHEARAMPRMIEALRARVVQYTGEPFNACLLNLYRSGADSVGWHSDDDYDHGGLSAVASLSLGATRVFQMREKPKGPIQSVPLTDGDLLFMAPGFQDRWLHRLPKGGAGERINLTFRWMAA